MFIPIVGTAAAVFTDDDLLQRIAARDERAFTQLYQRHLASAYAITHRTCRDAADDAIQDAFLALWRDAPTYRPRPGGAVGWLHTIVRHRSLDLARKRPCGSELPSPPFRRHNATFSDSPASKPDTRTRRSPTASRSRSEPSRAGHASRSADSPTIPR
jgi:RNA polymerase sigma factor (sigma-70 family)